MPLVADIPIIGQSRQTQAIKALIRTLAESDSTVMITGESGTGKELIAHALHRHSARASAHFVPINCGAIPKDLLESELFGHRKGAFTGAIADRMGRFELAHQGTLFLDEIGDLPLEMQVKLLRVLQDGSVMAVGSNRTTPIDVRIVAATHRNLEQEVAEGRFREDLYYRLNVLPCHTTPLRERPDDIPDLLRFYADRHARKGRAPIRFGPDLIRAMQAYRWPGNVRELSNLVDRFTTLYPSQLLGLYDIPAHMLPSGLAAMQKPALGAIATADVTAEAMAEAETMALHPGLGLPPPDAPEPATTEAPDEAPNAAVAEDAPPSTPEEADSRLPENGLALKQHMVQIERSLIEQALLRTQGNVSQTARLLQLQRTTLIEKINKYALRGHTQDP
jgi:sigma-54 dependent transcriptional regulator, flagellar regulatory protein